MSRLLAPPVFPEADRTRTARELYLIAWAVVLAISPPLLVALLFLPQHAVRWLALMGGVDAVGLLALALTRRGRLRGATLLLCVGGWALVTAAAWTAGGIRGPAVYYYVAIVFGIGILLGERWGFAAGGWCALTGLMLLLAGRWGLRPPDAIPYGDAFAEGSLVAVTLLVLGLQFVAASEQRRALKRIETELEARVRAEALALREASAKEAALQEAHKSELRFRTLIEGAPLAIHIARDGRTAYANPACIRMFGFDDLEDMLGRPIMELVAPQSRDIVKAHDLRRRQGLPVPAVYEMVGLRRDASEMWVGVAVTLVELADGPASVAFMHDITPRKQMEEEREITVQLLRILDAESDLQGALRGVLQLLQAWSGCDAAGIRLQEGDDFPYFETSGFSAQFVKTENSLCSRDPAGVSARDAAGNPVLECMCGNVLCSHTDHAQPFFTARGSFWTNSTTRLLASTTEADRPAGRRVRCNGEGYESVALIPLRAVGVTYGLLQLDDHREGRFSVGRIKQLERLCENVAIAVAKHRAQKALEASEARLRLALAASKQGIFELDLVAGKATVSAEFAFVMGYEPAELREISWREHVHPDDRPGVARMHAEVMAGRSDEINAEYRLLAKSGEWKWVQSHGQVVERDGAGQPLRILGTAMDISERKRAEEALKASEDRFRALIEQAPVAIAISRGGINSYANPACLRMFGFEGAEELAGRAIFDLIAPRSRAMVVSRMQHRAQRQPEPTEYDLVVQRKDGTEFPAHIAVTLVSLADGPAGVALFTDITDRVSAELALRDSEARFRGVFEQAALGIGLTTPEGQFLRANRKLCEILGYTEGELAALNFRDITHPDDLTANESLREHALAGETDSYVMEKRYIRKDGTTVWTNLTSSLVRGPSGEPGYVIGMIDDVTARKQLEDALRRQREQLEHATRVRSMGELTATLAHELSQPLTAIVSNAHAAGRLLAADPPDLAEAGAALSDIAYAGQRAADVIRGMRAMLRKGEPRRTALDINQLIFETIPLVKSRLQLGGIALRTQLEPGLPLLHGDQIELQQALLNLFLNAMDAMCDCKPGARELVLSSARSGPSLVQVDLCDAGVGLAEQELARVFDPFYTTKPEGLGMGLPITQTIVRAHGGRIWATRNPERGITMHVVLPVGPEAA